MNSGKIFLGDSEIRPNDSKVEGTFVERENEIFYKISNVDLMPEFFMTIVSDSDHWMFLASQGSLSAGRKDKDNALFPYYTVDKIHDSANITGSITSLIIEKEEKRHLWEPFNSCKNNIYNVESNIYKSIYGNKVIFEEINHDMMISFSYGWFNSEKFGFVRRSLISNLGPGKVSVELLDGIRNILPYGVTTVLQTEYSNLSDAYKKNELVEETGLGLFLLSSIPVDRAEPSESLKATTVWSQGLDGSKILLSGRQIEDFRKGRPITGETDVRASRGAYILNNTISLNASEEKEWMIVAEINQDSADVSDLNDRLRKGKEIQSAVINDIKAGTVNLTKIVASADGMQLGERKLSYARHFSNTLFNIMRGGVFPRNYDIEISDLSSYIATVNRPLYNSGKKWIKGLPSSLKYGELVAKAEASGNNDLSRICMEYLPLTFSRRHGDPSRPWNQFSIETRNEDGSIKYNYQGNWRDIFQNWEALSISFPEYIEGMIARFVNATTADGYNPYRISREGIDWEAPNPEDPWAYIGYWGDHQIIYLQKLLELSADFHPGTLDRMMKSDIFVYANVPYRIKHYEEIKKNPKDTIVFDRELNVLIAEKVSSTGADGRLLANKSGEICHVNFTEKIMVTLLAKLSNFIPEAGIWLNTQRPEWNDANNAIVGNGTSMVTLYYLRRFVAFWEKQYAGSTLTEVKISQELKQLFDKINGFLSAEAHLLDNNSFTDADRLRFADFLGSAGDTYRTSIYDRSLTGVKEIITLSELCSFLTLCRRYIDQSIHANRRDDNLYHAYNLVTFSKKGISIRYLYEMLEGQVAVLSSGVLTPQEGLDVLNALKASKLFRADQYSYLLYPDRQLPLFVEKNNIPQEVVKESALLTQLGRDEEKSVIRKDHSGNFHFNGNIRNAFMLEQAIDDLPDELYGKLKETDKSYILEKFEAIFDHQSFTGRSGTFYGYEGLGSIYWHMVSKLLLATQDVYFNAMEEKAEWWLLGKIQEHYYEIKAGIGLYKSPDLYGAFPTDAYSHTPKDQGVKQPGMTGQVKEDFISRIRELGAHVAGGKIDFNHFLLNPDEFLNKSEHFIYYDVNGTARELNIRKDELAYTICQVPVIYSRGEKTGLTVTKKNGDEIFFENHTIPQDLSSLIFTRSGEIEKVRVFLKYN